MKYRLKHLYILVILIITILLTGFIAMLVHSYNQGINFTKQEFNKQLIQKGRQTAGVIEKDIMTLARELERLSGRPEIINFAVKSAGPLLSDYFNYMRIYNVSNLEFVDASGVIRFSLYDEMAVGEDVSNKKFFIDAAKLKSPLPVYKIVTIRGGVPGRKGLVIAMPVFMHNGKFNGALLFTIQINELLRGLIPQDKSDTVYSIVDNELNVLYTTGDSRRSALYETESYDPSYSDFIKALRTGNFYMSEYLSPRGGAVMAAVYPVMLGGNYASIVIATPVSSVTAVLTHVNRDYIISGIVAFFLIIGGSSLIVFFISRINIKLLDEMKRREGTELALKESEEWFRALFDQASDSIFLLGIDTGEPIILDANIAACKIHGYERIELLGKSIKFLDTPDTGKHVFSRIQKIESNGGRLSFEGEHVRKDGSVFPVDVSSQLITLNGRQYLIAIDRDITERKNTEILQKRSREELEFRVKERTRELSETNRLLLMEIVDRSKTEDLLKKQNELVKNTLEAITHPFYVVNAEDYNIEIANSAAKSYPDERKWKCYELIKRRNRPCSGDDSPCLLEEIKKTKKPAICEHVVYHHDENIGFYEVHGYPIFDYEGNVVQMIEYIIDITGKRRLETQLAHSQKMDSIGRLAGGIAHDFNNFLSVILTYGELASLHLKEGDPAWDHIMTIISAAEKAAVLPRQLLVFSRKQMLKMQVLSLNAVVNGMIRILDRMIGDDILLKFKKCGDLKSIRADAGQVEQILMNLAINSRDAMPRGGVLTIETADAVLEPEYARQHEGVLPGPYSMISVSDTGIGMNLNVQERIFEPFFTTKNNMGTGLGLATVYGIVKQHAGHIVVYSEPGVGTTFKIYFPAIAEDIPEENLLIPDKMSGGSETILIVDNEDSIRSLAVDSLKPLGYNVITASSGEAAIKNSEELGEKIHLLLTDIVMPGINGCELSRNIREIIPSIKVVYMSGYNYEMINEKMGNVTESMFIHKPLTPGKLARKIREVLDREEKKA